MTLESTGTERYSGRERRKPRLEPRSGDSEFLRAGLESFHACMARLHTRMELLQTRLARLHARMELFQTRLARLEARLE